SRCTLHALQTLRASAEDSPRSRAPMRRRCRLHRCRSYAWLASFPAFVALAAGAAFAQGGHEHSMPAATAAPDASSETTTATSSSASTFFFPDPDPGVAVLPARRAAQLATAGGIGAFHGFGFTDRLSLSGITFRHHGVDDAGRDYKAV